MEMNILMVLGLLHEANVRVNLLNDYNPANVTTKANESVQKVRFEQTEQYYAIPKYEISSAANLNLCFTLKGKAHDIEHERYFDAVQFKCVSIVKNAVLFKQYLDICPEDIQKVIDMGIDVVDNKIDLSKYDLATGIDNITDDDMANAIISNYMYNVFRERTTRQPATVLTEDEQWLKNNGYANGVWWPVITKSEVRVANCHVDTIKWEVDYRKTAPTIAGINNKLNAGKKLTELESKLSRVYANTKEFESCAQQLNTIKYAWYINNMCHNFEKDVTVAGETFHIAVKM